MYCPSGDTPTHWLAVGMSKSCRSSILRLTSMSCFCKERFCLKIQKTVFNLHVSHYDLQVSFKLFGSTGTFPSNYKHTSHTFHVKCMKLPVRKPFWQRFSSAKIIYLNVIRIWDLHVSKLRDNLQREHVHCVEVCLFHNRKWIKSRNNIIRIKLKTKMGTKLRIAHLGLLNGVVWVKFVQEGLYNHYHLIGFISQIWMWQTFAKVSLALYAAEKWRGDV